MSQQRNYEEVNAQSTNKRWEPQKPENAANQKYPTTLEGYFKKVTEMKGQNGMFNVYEIAMVDANNKPTVCIDVSGGKVMDDKLSEVLIGSFIQIKFDGKKQPAKGGNAYNDWKVFQDKNAIPYQQVFGEAVAQPAQNAAPATNDFPNAAANTNAPAATQNGNNNSNAGSAVSFEESDLPF